MALRLPTISQRRVSPNLRVQVPRGVAATLQQRLVNNTSPSLMPVALRSLVNSAPSLSTLRGAVTRALTNLPGGPAPNRTTNPNPEHPTTATPLKLIHRAIDRANTSVRLPDRGSFVTLFGQKLTMPDGSAGVIPKTPKPNLLSLNNIFSKIVSSGGTAQIRQTQTTALRQASYQARRNGRPNVAVPGGVFGALEKAMTRRVKPGTPTGVQGDRAPMYATSHTGALYNPSRAPVVVSVNMAVNRIAGTGTAVQPTPIPPATVPGAQKSLEAATGKAFAWAPPDLSSQSPASGGNAVQTSGSERILLLAGVAVLALVLLSRR